MFIKFNFIFISAAVISGILLCSCSTPEVDVFTMEHMIAINDDGSPHKYPVKIDSKVISTDEYVYSNHVNKIISSIKKSGRTNILIYVFGGMNSLDSTIERSAIYAKDISDTSDYYPILVNWESSLFDAYYDHLMWYRRGVRDPYFGPVLSPFYLIADLGRAVTRLPINIVYQSLGSFSDYELEPESTAFEDKEIKKMGIRAFAGKDYTPAFYRITRNIIYMIGFPTRIITTPFIDAGGKSAWDTMLRRTQTAFQISHSLNIKKDGKFDVAYSPPNGALSILMDALSDLYAQNSNYVFTLLGHSLGPVMINELIRRYPNLPYPNIVYMAPACSIKDAGNAIGPYMKKNPNTVFYNLCLHENADKYEMMWWAILPRGSILEWIDTFLGSPLVLTDLTLGKWNNAIRSLPMVSPELRPRMVIKAFGINDPETNTILLEIPDAHTDFSNPKLRFWQPAFWQIKTMTKNK
ncbi:MAG: hypothetical protein DRI44_02100 [Chlamydiae bacterium]|nr:MAG: hypothetical protein DRI44_02100 [Chlamydiota bacterium]